MNVQQIPTPDPAVRLDSPHARQLAASQLVPTLMTLLLHAKDIAQHPVLEEGVHELLSDMSSVCIQMNTRWSSDEQRAMRQTAETILRAFDAPTTRPGGRQIAHLLRADNILAFISPEHDGKAFCHYCSRPIEDATMTDYCSSICYASAMGEGA